MYFYYFCLLSKNKKSISTKTNIIFNHTSVVLSQIQWEGIYWLEICNINFIIKNTRGAIRICTKNTRNAICIKNVHWNATILLF